MKCKHKDLPPGAVFCPWCGERLVKERGAVKVPPPRLLPSGTYFNQLTVNGSRISISGETEEEYYTKARAAKMGLLGNKKAAPKLTLGTAIDRYIKENDGVLSPSTINAYKSYRKSRFSGFMDKDIGKINYQAMVNEEAKHAKPKTVANAWRLVTPALTAAGMDPPEVTLPKAAKAERPWLDYEQIQVFINALNGKNFEIGALLALHSLRRSELLHLTKEDIDLDNELIHVRGASVWTSSGLTDKDTNKNKSSARIVHIMIPRLKTLLEPLQGRLVTTYPTTLYSQINGLCESLGLPQVGVHGLRHSFASLAYHLGWSEQMTMLEGGWSNPAIVHEIYTHLAAKDVTSDIEKMKAFYTGADKLITQK